MPNEPHLLPAFYEKRVFRPERSTGCPINETPTSRSCGFANARARSDPPARQISATGMLQIRLIAISQAETPAHSHREALTDHPPKPGQKGIQAPAVNLRGLNDDLETGIPLIYFWSCVLNRDLRGLSPCHGGNCSGTEGLLRRDAH